MTPTAEPAELMLREVRKSYDGYLAVDRCSISLAKGEIVAILGPSGCGKSTLLNLIAGFEAPDTGDVMLRGKIINTVAPNRRNVAMVFQNYALFPHMTVAGNIAYGLKARGVPKAEWRPRVAEAIALLNLTGFDERYPAQLSGGQRQRVAVARAIVVNPDILLLDEAFSALDRNLRDRMQLELSLLLRRLAVTTIIVTHDQHEAFALADRIAIMKEGRIVQIGPPKDVYHSPADSYVLRFLGRANAIPGTAIDHDGGSAIRVTEGFAVPTAAAAEGPSVIHVRAEDVAVSATPTATHRHSAARVVLVTSLGAQQRVILDLDGAQIVAEIPTSSISDWSSLQSGMPVYIDLRPGSFIVDRKGAS